MNTECDLLKVAGGISKIVSSKSRRPAQYILFKDGMTVLRLDDQDYCTYHDCDSSARKLSVTVDPSEWERLFKWPGAGSLTGY